jgi:small subunit ribosomal protein S6
MIKKNLYEGMFLLDPREAKKGFEFCRDFVNKLTQKHGAEPRVTRKWDDRKLAFAINKQKRALYILSYFDALGDAIVKIERDALLSETVLRTLVVRAESVPEKVMEEPFDAPIAPQVETVNAVEEAPEAEPAVDTAAAAAPAAPAAKEAV